MSAFEIGACRSFRSQSPVLIEEDLEEILNDKLGEKQKTTDAALNCHKE
jgi:hypothetical protein